MSEILVSADRLQQLMDSQECLIADCRFDLGNPLRSEKDFVSGHIPGAVFANLDEHLSSPVTPATGRHPLPEPERFARFLASSGWRPGLLLVAYDENSSAFAGRMWWLMRYFGLDAALLDGGLAAWTRAGLPLEQGQQNPSPGVEPELSGNPGMTVNADEILHAADELTLVDARAPERFTGAVEPLDSRGGHIPGALNRPLGLNLNSDGTFKPAVELRAEFDRLFSGTDPSNVAHYCGSGVTACHNAFAMQLAGLGGSRVYPGSWSEWIRDESRPIATGNA